MKNIAPKNYLSIQTEGDLDHRDHTSSIDDLREAIEEIKTAEAGKLKLQNAKDLIDEL